MKPKLIRVECCKNCKHYTVTPNPLPWDDGGDCKLHNSSVDEDQKCDNYAGRDKNV